MGAAESAEIVARALADAGSTIMFGMPGGGNNLEIVGAAETAGIRFILGRYETTAAITAATFADLTGRPTAVVVTRGPGAASAVNGTAQALLDRQPLLVLTDTVSERDAPRISHQRIDQQALYSAVVKTGGVIGSDADAAAVASRAVEASLQAPAGPVHLDFDPAAVSRLPESAQASTGPTSDDLAKLTEILEGSDHPVLALGVGARPAADALRDLVRGTNIPVLTTYRAKGVIPESWSNAAGLLTGATTEAGVLNAADLIIAVGLDSVELIPNTWNYSVPVISLAAWHEDSPYFSPALELVDAVRDLVDHLRGHLRDKWAPAFAAEQRRAGLDKLIGGPAPRVGLAPHEVVQVTRAEAPQDAVATVDAGAHMLVCMPLWESDLVDGTLISSGLATMGYSVPAAIGAALANPGRRIVCFVGDGGLGMVVGELETMVRHNLPITVVVFNDSKLSLIAIKAKPEGHGGEGAITYTTIDFSQVAAGMGLHAARAETTGELAAALSASFAVAGPGLIDVTVDPHGYPYILDAIRGQQS